MARMILLSLPMELLSIKEINLVVVTFQLI